MYPRRPCRRVCEYLIFALKRISYEKVQSTFCTWIFNPEPMRIPADIGVKPLSSKASFARWNTQQYITINSADAKTPTANDVSILGRCMTVSRPKRPILYPAMLPKFRTEQHPVDKISTSHCTVIVKYHSSIVCPARCTKVLLRRSSISPSTHEFQHEHGRYAMDTKYTSAAPHPLIFPVSKTVNGQTADSQFVLYHYVVTRSAHIDRGPGLISIVVRTRYYNRCYAR